MLVRRTLSRILTPLLNDPRRRARARVRTEANRRRSGEPHRIAYFHQADDPYSHLAALLLPRLAASWDVEITPFLVAPPSAAAAPEPELLAAYARQDAADIAPAYGLAFDDPGRPPSPALLLLARSILAQAADAGAARFIACASAVGAALWRGDAAALEELAARKGAHDPRNTQAAEERGNRQRARLGHYLGATFHYGGEWYWGIDRLHYLEERLAALGAAAPGPAGAPGAGAPIASRRRVRAPAGSGADLTLVCFGSLRSPYTAVAMPRVQELAARTGVTQELRPVLPMVMRGLPVPPAKIRYISMDAKREADAAGVPYGHICDPVGRPVERAFSLYPWAQEQGRAAEYLAACLDAAWARGRDLAAVRTLQDTITQAGLDWTEARQHLDDPGWRPMMEDNRQQMFDLGLWGVPSFALKDANANVIFHTWGQDRLWLLESRIAQAANAPPRAMPGTATP